MIIVDRMNEDEFTRLIEEFKRLTENCTKQLDKKPSSYDVIWLSSPLEADTESKKVFKRLLRKLRKRQ